MGDSSIYLKNGRESMKKLFFLVAATSLLIVSLGTLVSCPYLVFEITLSADPRTGTAPLEVVFWADAFDDREIDTCWWNFGDGSPDVGGSWATMWHVTHTYAEPGHYTAQCLAKEKGILRDITAHKSINITVATPGGTLEISIDADPPSGCPSNEDPLEVFFTSEVAGGAPPFTYEWDFGDGSSSNDAQPDPHLYWPGGPYEVVLSVTDDEGTIGLSNMLTIEYCP
jgi:PKD repeat protein